MGSLKQKFAIASITASVSFNALASDTEYPPPEHDPNSPIVSQEESIEMVDFADLGLTDEELNFEMPTVEHSDLTNQLKGITDADSAINISTLIETNHLYYDLKEAASKGPEALDEYLSETQTSPYVALPLFDYGEIQDIYTMEFIEVLEQHGMDMELADKFFHVSSHGLEHIHDLIHASVQNTLSDPRIMIHASQNGDAEYSNLPKSLKEQIDSSLEAYNYMHAKITGNESQIVISDIAQLDQSYSSCLSPELIQSALYRAVDLSYESPLQGRERRELDIEERIEANYKGVDFDEGIHYEYAQGLQLPEQNANYTLIVAEPKDSEHSDVTHSYAENLAIQISPDGEGSEDVVFIATDQNYAETEASLSIAAYSSDNIVLSKSYGPAPYAHAYVYDHQFTVNANMNQIMQYNFHENNNTIQFIAAGNYYGEHSIAWSEEYGEIVHSQTMGTSTALPEGHAQRSVIIGAAHIENNTAYMSSYTSSGAEFLMETPDFYGSQAKGTSFSTPTAAGYYHQIAESYADVLTHEEIMMTALYSTETNIYNVTMENAKSLDLKAKSEADNGFDDDEDDYDYMDDMSYENKLFRNEKKMSESEIQNFEKTIFRTNAAGIPYNERAGAGLLNVEQWQKNLDTLKAIKQTFEHESEYLTEKIQIKGTENAASEDSMFKYKYTITAESDMTLDKQTLYLDQVGLNNVRITTPSGMKSDSLGTLSGYVSTRSFAGEDIKAGDEITIETSLPLGDDTEFTLRGFEDGSPVQALREYKLSEGQTLQPSTVYEGDQAFKPYSSDTTQFGTYAEFGQFKMANLIDREQSKIDQAPQSFQP